MMSSSHKRSPPQNLSTTENHDEDTKVPRKRNKSNSTPSDDIQTLKRMNFVMACKLVAQNAYLNYAERLQLIYMPVCMDRNSCMHASTRHLIITETPQKVLKLIKVEMEASNWCGALEVCILSITPTQYLSDVILKNVVEIMLNAHEDLSSGYTISHVLDKCKLVLTLHFSTHCPCLHEDIRKVYTNFLTSPMDKKERTWSNRTKFESENGIVNFCLTRLNYELGADSTDSALLDKTENTPEELRQTIKGLFYQKERFDIFEMLDRNERINRLMAVLHSIIELLQFDLAIRQSSRNSGMKRRYFAGQQTLMECVFENKKSEYNIASVSNTCRLILELFSKFVHLNYPEEHIKTMTLWLNAVMEMFYMKEQNSNFNYPIIASTGSKCKHIIKIFYDVISELPPQSIVSVLERVKPAYIRHLLSHLCCKNLLLSEEKETLQMLIDFLKEDKWKDFPRNEYNVITLKKLNVKRVIPSKLLKTLSIICNNPPINSSHKSVKYPKFYPFSTEDNEVDQSFIICTLYITLQSYLEAYGVQSIEDTLQKLNKELTQTCETEETTYYGVDKTFYDKYKIIFKMLKELILTIKEKESGGAPPEILNLFKKLFTNI